MNRTTSYKELLQEHLEAYYFFHLPSSLFVSLPIHNDKPWITMIIKERGTESGVDIIINIIAHFIYSLPDIKVLLSSKEQTTRNLDHWRWVLNRPNNCGHFQRPSQPRNQNCNHNIINNKHEKSIFLFFQDTYQKFVTLTSDVLDKGIVVSLNSLVLIGV